MSLLFLGLRSTLVGVSIIKRVNEVEGWGTLVTPYDTFSSVLKMKTIIERMDTFYFDTLQVATPITQVRYTWWDPAYGLPVLSVEGIVTPGGGTTVLGVTYLDSVRCVEPLPLFIPNPPLAVKDSAVQFISLAGNADSVIWVMVIRLPIFLPYIPTHARG